MSAPSRAHRGGPTTTMAQGRGSVTPASRGQLSSRSSFGASTRGPGRGRGRGAPSTTTGAEGLLQGLRNGTLNKRGSENGSNQTLRGRGTSTRGPPASRGRGSLSVNFANAPTPNSRPSSPAHSSHKDFMNEMTSKFQVLKQRREIERAKAIRDGFLADPEKKTSLDKAITPVGTCTDMCPEFERIERIVQNMVDKTEKTSNEATGRDIPSEARMIKRFRRSAAGYDEQLPSDIRTPVTLKRTLDYLLDKVVGGGERLASIHKFVWDRTRGIRNDFSIQQVSREEDVKIAVDCFERIARFHILSLHQLSNPENLLEGENFDAHQDREQLNNTLLSLIYYYDDYRQKIPFPNEAEFRAYCIIFELQSQHPDLEDRMQSWPQALLEDGRVRTAFQLFSAAGNNIFDQGPLRPLAPFSIAQGNPGTFWTIVQSRAVSYLMACVGEIYFAQVRFTALEGLWRSAKSAPIGVQAKSQDWTLAELSDLLALDTDRQTLEFCDTFGLSFKQSEGGERYLDLKTSISSLDKSLIPSQQVFSRLVEQKRYRRTLVAVINGISVPRAIREELIETDGYQEGESNETGADNEANTLFVPEKKTIQTVNEAAMPQSSSGLKPQAPSFPSPFASSQPSNSSTSSTFGKPSVFGAPSTTQKAAFESSSTSLSDIPLGKTPAKTLSLTSGRFGLSSASAFNGFPPATSTAPSATKPPLFSFPQNSTSSFTPSFSFSTATSAPSTSQVSPPTPAPSISTTASPASSAFTWQKPATQPPNTLFQEQSPQPPPAPISQPVQFGSLFPGQVPQSQAPNNPPPVVAQVSVQNSQGLEPIQLAPSVQLGYSAPKFPSFFPPPSSNSSPARQNVLPSSQPVSFSQLNQPSSSSFGTGSRQTPGPPQLFALQAPSAPPNIPPFVFTPSAQETSHISLSIEKGSSSKQLPDSEGSPKWRPTQPFPASSPVTTSNPFHSQLSSTPTEPEPPPWRDTRAAYRETAIDVTAQLALLQERGLMSEYLQHFLPRILGPVTATFQKIETDKVVKSARKKILAKKYGTRWRKLTWHNQLQRRAKVRRKLYAEFWKEEKEKKLRAEKRERELEEILQAQKEKEIVQEEQRQAQIAAQEKRKESARKSQEMLYGTSVMSRKRKSMGDEQVQSASPGQTPRKLLRTHRRSRTVGGGDGHTSSQINSPGTSPLGRRISIFSSKESQFGVFVPDPPHNRLSKTRTDYFRMKSFGLDPEAPTVPHTAASLAKKQKREAAEREAYLAATYAKGRMKRPLPAKSPERSSSPRLGTFLASLDAQPPPPPPIDCTESFKAIEEIKAMLAEGTDWYKEQSAILKEECKQQEELMRRSGSSYSSIYNPRLSANGLAIAPTGYEYRPDNTPPGQPLSRSEMRIRMTGAHGFATAPIGGTPGYTPKRSRIHPLQDGLDQEAEEARAFKTNGVTEKGKGSDHASKAVRYTELDDEDQDLGKPVLQTWQANLRNGSVPQQRGPSKAATSRESDKSTYSSRHASPSKQASSSPTGSSANPYATLNSVVDDDDEEDEDREAEAEAENGESLFEDDEEEEAENSDDLFGGDIVQEKYTQGVRDYAALGGDTEEAYDDDELEEEDEEDEEDDEDEYESEEGADIDQMAKHAYLQLPNDERQDSYGGSQMSRATSGTGVSAEDALVLDSD